MGTKKILRVAVVGAGHRSVAYAKYALRHPESMKVTAVADPDPVRRNQFAVTHGIPRENRFESYTDLLDRPDLADAVINGTMDSLHYKSGMALMNAGFDMLIEKPVTQSAREMVDLADLATGESRTVMVCHVLRYAPLYQTVKRLIDEGRIGKVMGLHSEENVAYHHMAVGYVRGKWNHAGEETPVLLAKCCHDLDLVSWLMPSEALRVSSFGSRMFFRSEQAPAGAHKRCLPDCPHLETCIYSAPINYLRSDEWGTYVWHDVEYRGNMTMEEKREHLETASPFGRCVWHCDNDQFDQQRVMIEFADGSSATHVMNTGVVRPTRELHIFGTEGEIDADFVSGHITVRNADLDNVSFKEELIDVNMIGNESSGHGGGDDRLIGDFVRTCQGTNAEKAHTLIQDSVEGHLIGFAAMKSQQEVRVVELSELGKRAE